jgi:hypothetical protein
MRSRRALWMTVAAAAAAVSMQAQPPRAGVEAGKASPTRTPDRPYAVTPGQTATPPPFVPGYVGQLDIEASLPVLKDGATGPPEAQALLGRLRDKAKLSTTAYLTTSLSRLEVLSTDFLLPAGTVVLHEAGSRFHVIADPREKTYVVMDVEGILNALEGGIGIANSQYKAKVTHTADKRAIGAYTCRKSDLVVNYASAIPFENSMVYVQQTNNIEVWHTPQLVSSALVDHFFFKFERDKTHAVQKAVAQEIGFPMEMTMTIAPQGGRNAGTTGTLSVKVSGLKEEKKLASDLFRIPPAGFRKLDRNPYFKGAAVP